MPTPLSPRRCTKLPKPWKESRSTSSTSLVLARDLRLAAHRRATRPDAASIARLIPRCALAPAAQGSSLRLLGRLLAPRPEPRNAGSAPGGAPASDSAGCGLDRSPDPALRARSRGARLLPPITRETPCAATGAKKRGICAWLLRSVTSRRLIAPRPGQGSWGIGLQLLGRLGRLAAAWRHLGRLAWRFLDGARRRIRERPALAIIVGRSRIGKILAGHLLGVPFGTVTAIGIQERGSVLALSGRQRGSFRQGAPRRRGGFR